MSKVLTRRQPPAEAVSEPEVFRLAHVSDLHLAAEAGIGGFHQSAGFLDHAAMWVQMFRRLDVAPSMTSYDSKCYRALINALTGNNRFTSRGYDGFLFTGDLSTTGLPKDVGAAANILRRTEGYPGTESLADEPAKLPCDSVVLLPGNHDRYHGRRLAPDSSCFEHLDNFGTNWSLYNQKPGDKRTDVNDKVLVSRSGAKLGVVSGDFSYVSPRPNYFRMLGGGEARQTTINEMIGRTNYLASREIPVVWAVHFPPVKKGVKSLLRLERHEEVVRAAAQAGVETIFSGHTHKPDVFEASYEDKFTGIKVVCAGSACEHALPGTQDRTYFEVELELRKGKARLRRRPVPMIYSTWAARELINGRYGRGAEFCPAP